MSFGSKRKPFGDLYLKPCPFCGDKAELGKRLAVQGESHVAYYSVECRKCGASTKKRFWLSLKGIADLVDYWNTRHEGENV
jgi:Lar family restriction alleviation protein